MERRPDPPPLPTDDVRIVVIGTVLWAVALVVFAVLRDGDAAATCGAGLLLGFVGVAYTRRRAAAIERDRRASPNGPGDAGP